MANITKVCNALISSRSTFLMANRSQLRTMCSSLKEKSKQELEQSLRLTHIPNNFEKKMLVWTKKYKSVEEVPDIINQEVMERARNRMRIKISNYLMLLTGLGCVIMIYSGKKAAERGESVAKSNLQWHKEYNEKTKRSETDYSTHFDKLAQAGEEEAKKAAIITPK